MLLSTTVFAVSSDNIYIPVEETSDEINECSCHDDSCHNNIITSRDYEIMQHDIASFNINRNILCDLFGHSSTTTTTWMTHNVMCRYVGDSYCMVKCYVYTHCSRCNEVISSTTTHATEACLRDGYECTQSH